MKYLLNIWRKLKLRLLRPKNGRTKHPAHLDVHFEDDFNRANGAVGNNWQSIGGGTVSIASNQLRLIPLGGWLSCVQDVGFLNADVRGQMTSDGGLIGSAIVARFVAWQNTIRLERLGVDLTHDWRLLKVVNGVGTTLGTGATTENWRRLVVQGTAVSAYLSGDGVAWRLVAEATVENPELQTGTKVGFNCMSADGAAQFDNFVVARLA